MLFGTFGIGVVVVTGLVSLGRYDERSEARWQALTRHVDVQSSALNSRLDSQSAQVNSRIDREVELGRTRREAADRAAESRLNALETSQRADDILLRSIIERMTRVETNIDSIRSQNDSILKAIDSLRDNLRRPAFVLPNNQPGSNQ